MASPDSSAPGPVDVWIPLQCDGIGAYGSRAYGKVPTLKTARRVGDQRAIVGNQQFGIAVGFGQR